MSTQRTSTNGAETLPPIPPTTIIDVPPFPVTVGASPSSTLSPRGLVRLLRASLREEVAEFFGTGLIVLFGAGVQCQVQLYELGGYATCALGWAAGVALGAYVAGPTSGAHINPAVTIALALLRRFPVQKVPRYIAAQIAGAAAAALLVYANYRDAIRAFEGDVPLFAPTSVAGNFITRPSPAISGRTAYGEELLITAILLATIFALTDQRNPSSFSVPIALFILVLGIGVSFGAQTGYAVNPARDFGPRLALWLLGYGSELWTHDDGYWLWVPWLACIPGGILGGFLYDFWLNIGDNSIFNEPAISI